MVDSLKLNSYEEHLKELRVFSSEKTIPSGDTHLKKKKTLTADTQKKRCVQRFSKKKIQHQCIEVTAHWPNN